MYTSLMYPLHEAVIISAALVGGFMAVAWAMKVLLFDDESEKQNDSRRHKQSKQIKDAMRKERIMANIKYKETLCWTCKNAVPDDKGLYGCSWSIGLKPVKGWDATYMKRKHAEDTYHVISCPEYISD